MIYIIASAGFNKNKEFKLKRLYIAGMDKSYIIDFAHNNAVLESSVTVQDLLSIYKSQPFYVNDLVYTPVRALQGDDAETPTKLISKQLEELRSIKDYDLTVFKTISNYGVEYAG